MARFKYLKVATFVILLLISTSVLAFSLSGAIKGAFVGSLFGQPTAGLVVGANGGVEPTLEDLNEWRADLSELQSALDLSNIDLIAQIENEFTKIVINGIQILGLGSIYEEFLWLSYKGYVSLVNSDARNITPDPGFLADYATNYDAFFDTPINEITFRVHSSGTLGDSHLTDCRTIYLVENSTAAQIVGLNSFPVGDDWRILLHELKHVDQCGDIGSRKEYGIYWWENLIATGLVQPDEIIQGTLAIGDFSEFHDAMPMEVDAENCADEILLRIVDACDSHLVSRPAKIVASVVLPAARLILH